MLHRSSLLAVILWGCGAPVEPEDTHQDPPGPVQVPDIGWDSASLDLGEVPVAQWESPLGAFTLSNQGGDTLTITSIAFEGEDSGFVLDLPDDLTIEPGGSTELGVRLSPETIGARTAIVKVLSDDPDEGQVLLNLQATAVGPALEVGPLDLSLEGTTIGCPADGELWLSNQGLDDLEITDLGFSTDLSALVLTGSTPATLAPGERLVLSFSYAPLAEESGSAWLHITSNDPFSPATDWTIPASTGALDLRSEDFSMPLFSSADLLIAVDRTSAEYSSTVSPATPALAAALQARGLDYRMTATVEDDGCINGPDLYVDNTFAAADVATVFKTMINLGNTYASNSERTFMLLDAALDAAKAGGCDSGLLREGAPLHLVGISDELDQSTHAYPYYLSIFQAVKEDPALVRIDAIGGPIGGCRGASAYSGMYEATVATGGIFLSICDPMEDNFEALADRVYETNEEMRADWSFELGQAPVEGTVQVQVDGINSTAWTLDGATLKLDSPAADGAAIHVEYSALHDCG